METIRKKEIGLIIATTIYSFIFFLSVAVFIDEAIQSFAVAIILILAGILWTAIIGPSIAVAKSIFATAGLVAIPALIVIIVGLGKSGAVVAALVLAALCLGSSYAYKREFDNNVRYLPIRVYPRGTKLIIYAAIVASIGISFSTTSQLFDVDKLRIENDQVNMVVEPLKPVISGIVGQVQGTLPVISRQIQSTALDQIIDQTLEQELAKYPPGTLTPEQESDIRRQIEEAVESQQVDLEAQQPSIIEQFITPEFLTPIITNFINEQIRVTADSYPIFFPLLIIAVAFLALRALMPIFVGLSVGAITLIIYISIKLNLVKLDRVQAEVEKITL